MIGGIILAAGSSRRFGDDKRKISLPSGNSVLVEAIHNAAAVLQSVLVVLRFGDQAFQDQLEAEIDNPNVSYLRAPDSARGMAHSLGNAVHRVKDWDAAVVLLGDMPFLGQNTIKAILNAYIENEARAPIIYPIHKGRPGHPVLFDHTYFAELELLEGDVGARSVIDAHPDRVIIVEVDDPNILRDIDTPDDLAS